MSQTKALQDRKIGLALSGGGYRAAIFHLGTLKKIAECSLLEQVTFISTVSGGSLLVGLIYALSGNKWPTSKTFLESVYPNARKILLESNLENRILFSLFRLRTWWKSGFPALTSLALQQHWGMSGELADLPEHPRWIINATTYETGKNFRFMTKRMGDYVLNYVEKPKIKIADAVSASAGFPILIGPYILPTESLAWFQFPDGGSAPVAAKCAYKKVHLWDGGVYDNLGLEALFKTNKAQFREGFDFLIVSDGSLPLGGHTSRWHMSRAKRLVDIATSQSRNLMVRSLWKHLSDNPYSGAFFQIGISAKSIVRTSPKKGSIVDSKFYEKFLDDGKATAQSALGTRLKPMSSETTDELLRHGWEVAHLTLGCFCGDYFTLM